MEIVNLPLEEVLALPTYPTADIFPMLLDEAEPPAGYEGMTIHQFADQILREGVREPLVLWNGFLLDGRNRREAARLANKATPGSVKTLPVRYETFEEEEEADSWVLSLNIDRRNMNKDQLACLAVRYWEIIGGRHGGDRKSDQADKNVSLIGNTRDILSNRFHVSPVYIQKARGLWLTDRPKFEQAASGRKRVIAGLLSPGQQITTNEDPLEKAKKNWLNVASNVRQGIKQFKKEDHTDTRLTFILESLESLKEYATQEWE